MPVMAMGERAEAIELGQEMAWETLREQIRRQWPTVTLRYPEWKFIQGAWHVEFKANAQRIQLGPVAESLLTDAVLEDGCEEALRERAIQLVDQISGGTD